MRDQDWFRRNFWGYCVQFAFKHGLLTGDEKRDIRTVERLKNNLTDVFAA